VLESGKRITRTISLAAGRAWKVVLMNWNKDSNEQDRRHNFEMKQVARFQGVYLKHRKVVIN
jgi:hypothetical protein